MTTLEQQIAHFKDYWNVPQEDTDKLIELVLANYLENLNQVGQNKGSLSIIDTLMKDYVKYVNNANY